MKNLAIVIVILIAVGLVSWAASSVNSDQTEGPTQTANSVASVDTIESEMVTPKRSIESRPQSSVNATSRPAGHQAATTQPGEVSSVDNAMVAVRAAADAKKHLFVFVQGGEQGEPIQAARKTFDAAVQQLGDKIHVLTVDRDAVSEREFVEKYSLQKAPVPVVLVLAPNGAITGGFLGTQLSEQQLVESLASDAKQKCLKALQDRKLVLLCVQNASTASNDTAMKGVNAFKSDARYADFTEVVMFDPADPAESTFLTQLQLTEKLSEATTIFLAPPGSLVAKFTGAIEKDDLVKALQKASSGCGPGGCGPRGCGPKK